MDAAALRADCARCAALCCVALAFDRSDDFGADKPADAPCPHLDDGCRCAIHATRAQQGFGGCVVYDCLGAGQRVTQELFAGRSWRDDAGLLAPMAEAFRAMRRVHELLVLLDAAGRASLSVEERAVLRELRAALDPIGGWSRETLEPARIDGLARSTHGFLRSLRNRFLAAS
jgi:hypothetical protein